MIIAPLVFATLVGGIAHMGSGSKLGRIFAKTMGWFISASFVSLLLGLVMVNLLQPGANFPGTLPDDRAIDGIAGLGVLGRKVPHPSDPHLDRGRDGAERDPADRDLRDVLRGRRWDRCRNAPSRCCALIDDLGHIMLKVTGYVMLFAPLAVWAAIMATVVEERPRRAVEAGVSSWAASICRWRSSGSS